MSQDPNMQFKRSQGREPLISWRKHRGAVVFYAHLQQKTHLLARARLGLHAADRLDAIEGVQSVFVSAT